MSSARYMSKSPEHEHQWLPFRHRTFSHFMTDTLPSNILVFHLLATAFITGVLDATTFADYGVFTSNQTGNAVLLGIGTIGISHISLIDVGTSLSSFLVTALICGQIAVRLRPGKGRTRWWTLASSFYQSIVILTLPVLFCRHAIQVDRHWSWLVIFLLASSAGSQVAMAKQFSIPEIPTAMLTSPFADVLTDPYMFSTTLTKDYNIPRNRRLAYISLLIAGVFVGAVIHKHAGTRNVLLFAGCLKMAVFFGLFFTPREEQTKDQG